MSSDTELEARDIRDGYIVWCRGELTRDMAGEKFDRFIAKVKADARNEAIDCVSRHYEDYLPAEWSWKVEKELGG